ncbi:MAG: SsrA-binding protein SmpB [Proteobacteria bacterium]|nr:SsrA-binding protein SmpB [Pseudomonadota bacterium]
MAAPRKKKPDRDIRIIAKNRKARFNYEILDTFEAGIELKGTEVKSLRTQAPSLAESYAEVKEGEVFLVNAHIPEFSHGNQSNHQPRRPRRLLLHKKQINKLAAASQRQGLTLIPLMLYFNEKNRVKLALGLAKGKKRHDKREAQKKRDWQRQKEILLKDRG